MLLNDEEFRAFIQDARKVIEHYNTFTYEEQPYLHWINRFVPLDDIKVAADILSVKDLNLHHFSDDKHSFIFRSLLHVEVMLRIFHKSNLQALQHRVVTEAIRNERTDATLLQRFLQIFPSDSNQHALTLADGMRKFVEVYALAYLADTTPPSNVVKRNIFTYLPTHGIVFKELNSTLPIPKVVESTMGILLDKGFVGIVVHGETKEKMNRSREIMSEIEN